MVEVLTPVAIATIATIAGAVIGYYVRQSIAEREREQ